MGEKASFLGSWARWLWLKMLHLDKSPTERFTNGYTWADALKARLVSKFASDTQIKKIRLMGLVDIIWIMQT